MMLGSVRKEAGTWVRSERGVWEERRRVVVILAIEFQSEGVWKADETLVLCYI